MSKNFKIIIFFALVAILTPLFLIGQGGFASVYASVDTNPAVSSLQITAGEAGLTSEKDPIEIAGTIVEFLLGFLGIIFIVLLMYGGFLRMTAQGAADKVSTSMKIITSAIIGVFIILASWIITAYVFDQVNYQVGGDSGSVTMCNCVDTVNGSCQEQGYVSGGSCSPGCDYSTETCCCK